MPCEEVVVYEIPVECGHVYIEQIGRCFDERVLEHEGNTKKQSSKFSFNYRHLEDCSNCSPVWDGCRLLDKEKNDYKGLVLKTMHIFTAGNCMTAPSLTFNMITRR